MKEILIIMSGVALFSPILVIMADGWVKLIGLGWFVIISWYHIDIYIKYKELEAKDDKDSKHGGKELIE